jgi:hypothetical protein
MAAKTAAQEEFDSIVAKASTSQPLGHHPDDLEDYKHDRANGDRDEEEEYNQKRVDENMRLPTFDRSGGTLLLPHRDFDNGRTTGVKGVIADARSYEEAKMNGGWRNKFSRRSSTSRADKRASSATFLKEDGEGNDIRNRRTSPSVRRYGRFDEVDALGYLDAIEKVTRDTIVVVFVYDHEVCYIIFEFNM